LTSTVGSTLSDITLSPHCVVFRARSPIGSTRPAPLKAITQGERRTSAPRKTIPNIHKELPPVAFVTKHGRPGDDVVPVMIESPHCDRPRAQGRTAAMSAPHIATSPASTAIRQVASVRRSPAPPTIGPVRSIRLALFS